MIAGTTSFTDDRTEALGRLSAEQDALAAQGRQTTYTQTEIAGRMGLTRSAVEQLEMTAKLRLLIGLGRCSPQSFLDLGGTIEQLAFLQSATLRPTNARRLWRQWVRMSS